MEPAIRVLMVDDNPEDVRKFGGLLRGEGCEVLTASTGSEGLRLARDARPALALLGSRLGNGAGIDVCRQIKADSSMRDVFVALFVNEITACGNGESGADDCLFKNTDEAMFLARIRTLLRLQKTTMALRASEEQFRQMAENIREVFWIITPERDKLLYVSPAYEAVWGRTCKSLYESPRSWLLAVHPADRQRVIDTTTTDGEFREEYRIKRPDGTLRWIFDRAFPIRDEAGNIRRIAGIAEDITERKLAEEALCESETRQNAIVEAALDGIITFTPTGVIIEMNSTAEKMVGCSRAMAVGRNICDVVVPASLRDWFRRGLAHYFAVDEAPVLDGRFEISALRADGLEFPAEFTITRIQLVGPPLFTAFIRDITRRKQAEARASMLAHAVESTAEPICITDLEDRFMFVNRAFQKTYGYTESEILGRRPSMLWSESNSPKLLEEILEHSRSGGWRGEVVDRKKDGTEFPVFLSTSRITDQAGKAIGLLGVAQDITERKQAQERLAEALELNRTILASSSLGILAYRATGGCVFANEAAGRIFHTSLDKLLKQDFLHPGRWHQGGLDKLAHEALRSGKVQTTETRWTAPSGGEIWLDWRLASFVSGGELHLLALVDDITDRKRAEEELRRLPQRIIEAEETERFRVARELHDGVNQIIAAAKVKLAEVRNRVAPSSPASAEMLSRCGALLVRALEENRRLAQNLRPGELDNFGFIVACRNFCKDFKLRTNIEVRVRIHEPGVRLPPAAELHLFRIVQETFNNIQSHARATIVWLAITETGGSLLLRICDNGAGFDPKALLNRRKKRRGIGLANLHERAALMHGVCDVESERGKGTTVTIRVPLPGADNAADHSLPASTQQTA